MLKKLYFGAFMLLLPAFSFAAEEYQAQFISQDQGTWGSIKAHVIFPGESKTITAVFKNIGKKCWTNDQDDEGFVGFYVYKDLVFSTPKILNDRSRPDFGSSIWASASWGTSYDGKTNNARAASLKEKKVCPGEKGTFTFSLAAPDDVSSYANTEWIPSSLLKQRMNDKNYAGRYFHREDLSLAFRDQWMKADAPYPKGTGDPLGIAHVWFPIRFEDAILSQQEVDAYDEYVENLMKEPLEFLDQIGSVGGKTQVEELFRSAESYLKSIQKASESLASEFPPFELQVYHDLSLKMVASLEDFGLKTVQFLKRAQNTSNFSQKDIDEYTRYHQDLVKNMQHSEEKIKKEFDRLRKEWKEIKFPE